MAENGRKQLRRWYGLTRYQFLRWILDGKTILVNLLLLLLMAVSLLQLKDVDFPEEIGAMIETPSFLNYLTGYQNLELLAEINHKIGKKEIEAAMEAVGLSPSLKKKTGKYSLGMRQRLGIAQAIMEDPDILILDEPFNGLDADGVSLVRNLLLEWKQKGRLILIASHISVDIQILCDEVYEMNRGSLERKEL